jgi:Na+-driven multidrug efflux pump
MGEGDSHKANKFFRLTFLYSFILNATIGMFIIYFREGLARIFTNQEELIPLIK